MRHPRRHCHGSHILRLLPAFILQEEQVDMLRDTLADLPA